MLGCICIVTCVLVIVRVELLSVGYLLLVFISWMITLFDPWPLAGNTCSSRPTAIIWTV